MPEKTFRTLYEHTSGATIDDVSLCFDKLYKDIATTFYSSMLSETEAKAYLDNEKVETRLSAEFQKWAEFIFSSSAQFNTQHLFEHHNLIGTVHARIGIPSRLIAHGMQVVKRFCFNELIETTTTENKTLLKDRIIYVNELLDTCLEVMTSAYINRALADERTAQALRFKMANVDISIECERMKTELTAWTRDMFLLASGTDTALVKESADIYSSIFGAWLNHKAPIYFSDFDELEKMRSSVAKIDEMTAALMKPEVFRSSMERIRLLTNEVCWYLDQIVERSQKEYESRDALTSLYNRRFLDSVLKRETKIASGRQLNYALAMIDIDDFKQVNDEYGHQFGDKVLREVSAIIQSSVRPTDFCFRYGGEEILIVLTEVKETEPAKKGETIRHAIENQAHMTDTGQIVKVTVSIGCATFSGHPDYETLISEADANLYKAKAEGKNCVVS